jgi:hypothetical protein
MRPNLFLLAAPRSGSTQLARWLDSHAEIALSPVKEPNFYSAHEFPADWVAAERLNDVDPARYLRKTRRRPAQFAVFRRRGDYMRLFAGLTVPWRLDASTSYLACPEAPRRIFKDNPGAHIISLTRDPLQRALSHYRLAIRSGRTRRCLRQELEAELAGQPPLAGRFLLRPSRQDEGLSHIAAVCPPGQHLRLTYEELFRDPAEVLGRIGRFLRIAPGGFDLSYTARNAGVAPRFPRANHLLHQSGIRTPLRRAIPAPLKPALKRLVFTDRAVPIPQDQVAELEAHL